MPIYMPEKLTQAILTTQFAIIKGNLSEYLPDIFDAELFGEEYLATVEEYLTATKVHIVQGFPLSDERLPGWFITPASMQPDGRDFIGDFVADDAEEDGEVLENMGSPTNCSVRVITASLNADVAIFLEAICRYILYASQGSLIEQNFHEISISTLDIDPIWQFLPENYYKRTTMMRGVTLDTWSAKLPTVHELRSFGKFSTREDHQEI